MKTDTAATALSSRDSEGSAASSLESWLDSEWLPWVIVPLLLMGFWTSEAFLHSVAFDHRNFATDFWSPDHHELWMRLLVAVMLLIVASLWSAAIRQRNARLAETIAYRDRLQALASSLSQADGEDRRFLADRLHEHVAQSLSAARMFLSSVETAGTASKDALTSAENILDNAIADCRDIAQELSPQVLNEYGLEPAVEELARRVSRRSGATVSVTGVANAPLRRDVLLATFQAIAEVVELAASNPVTSAVRITMRKSASALLVDIEWDTSSDADPFAARERMLRIGGTVERFSTTLSSTVSITAPLAS